MEIGEAAYYVCSYREKRRGFSGAGEVEISILKNIKKKNFK
jgi:hypothetical protein